LAKKIKNEALAGQVAGQSACNCVQKCLFHVCHFDVSTVAIGFPVTDGGLALGFFALTEFD